MSLSGVHGLKYLDSRLKISGIMVRTRLWFTMKGQKEKQKRGFPIKTFGNDGGDGFLNGSTRNLNNGRRHLYGSKEKAWMSDKDFRHDERGVIPEWFYQQSGTIRAKSTYRLLFLLPQ